jgi:hypothetical protein
MGRYFDDETMWLGQVGDVLSSVSPGARRSPIDAGSDRTRSFEKTAFKDENNALFY